LHLISLHQGLEDALERERAAEPQAVRRLSIASMAGRSGDLHCSRLDGSHLKPFTLVGAAEKVADISPLTRIRAGPMICSPTPWLGTARAASAHFDSPPGSLGLIGRTSALRSLPEAMLDRYGLRNGQGHRPSGDRSNTVDSCSPSYPQQSTIINSREFNDLHYCAKDSLDK
jgi:hypothetical protein